MFTKPIYAFDEKNCVFRFKGGQDLIFCSDEKAAGMVAFKPEDFAAFVELYIGRCDSWSNVQLESAGKLLNDYR